MQVSADTVWTTDDPEDGGNTLPSPFCSKRDPLQKRRSFIFYLFFFFHYFLLKVEISRFAFQELIQMKSVTFMVECN